ncbi:MAG: hypothetical protein NW207_03755 [Cytophagales bacterium]|nr:hypothetical protein [Cytophagales bacterium]
MLNNIHTLFIYLFLMYVIARTLFYMSIIFFILSLFFAYYQLPDVVNVSFDDAVLLRSFSKSNMFYIFASIFILINALNIWLIHIFNKIDKIPRWAPNFVFWSASDESIEYFYKILSYMAYSYATLLNVFCALILLSFFVVVVTQTFTILQMAPVYLTFIIIICLWWAWLPIRLMISKTELYS